MMGGETILRPGSSLRRWFVSSTPKAKRIILGFGSGAKSGYRHQFIGDQQSGSAGRGHGEHHTLAQGTFDKM